MNLSSKVRGCILGGAVGDALGAPIEFLSLGEIHRLYGEDGLDHMVWHDTGHIGTVTDDTQMTLFAMEGLIHGEPSLTEAVYEAHRRWYATQVLRAPTRGEVRLPVGGVVVLDGGLSDEAWLYARRAPGNSCLSGLRTGVRGTLERPNNARSKGCGSVMRSAPFGLLPGQTPEGAFWLAAGCAVQTHGHPTGYLAAGAFAAIVRFLLDDLDLEAAVEKTLKMLAPIEGSAETHHHLQRAWDAARQGGPTAERLEALGSGWTAEEALAISVYSALCHIDDARAALLLAVNHSGDSDSTGAITGNLMGAWHGEQAVPRAWVSAIEGRTTIERLADGFVERYTPRP